MLNHNIKTNITYMYMYVSWITHAKLSVYNTFERVLLIGRGEVSDALIELINCLNTFSKNWVRFRNSCKCLRPYHAECTRSRPITEVKQRRARLVLGWVTAWEYRVL